MIKNLDDLLSLLVLIIITIISLRLFIWSFVKTNGSDDSDNNINKWQLIKDYIDNIEE